jgi:hypothetical protein
MDMDSSVCLTAQDVAVSGGCNVWRHSAYGRRMGNQNIKALMLPDA